ncbi:MAG: sensor histidine kinase [Actinobacteria bacterium]|nr:sensor histidine kinase [Actinomycetota bacterium]
MSASLPVNTHSGGLRHAALFYSGPDKFAELTASFVRQGLDAGEAVMVLAKGEKAGALKEELGSKAAEVLFGDMEEIGRNPARILPVWQDFITSHDGSNRGLRGVGEPIWAGRTPEEIVEAQRHESLINFALADAPLLIACPYDIGALEPDMIEEARRTHPLLLEEGDLEYRDSPAYRHTEDTGAPFDDPLPEPRSRPEEMPVSPDRIGELRIFVSRRSAAFGLDPARTEDLVLAVNEIVTNTLRHGGGRGVLRLWHEGHSLVCEVRDRGQIDEPMVGRMRPSPNQESGFGLWLVNHLCDLVQVRSFASGTVVRVHMGRTMPQSVA